MESPCVCGIDFKIVTGTPTGKIPLGRTRRRLDDSITMDLKEIDQHDELTRLRIGIIGEPCECGIEPSGFISQYDI